MENEEAKAHLQREACSAMIQQNSTVKPHVADDARHMRFELDKMPSRAFWALMENQAIRNHIEEQANRVVEMLTGKPKIQTEARGEDKDYIEVHLSPAEEVKVSVQLPCAPPKKNPEQILQLLASDNWEDKLNGLIDVQDLARHQPNSLKEHLCKITLAVSTEVKNQRSVVSKAAMGTLSVMFFCLKRNMNDTIRETGAVLLHKVSNSNVFIQQNANEALAAMVENCNPLKVLNTLVDVGLEHRACAVRSSAAQKIRSFLDVLGPNQFTRYKDFSKVFVLAVSKILQDRSVDVRKHGVAIYKEICDLKELQKLWKNIVPMKDQQAVDRQTEGP